MQAQTGEAILPKFTPAQGRDVVPAAYDDAPVTILPVAAQQPLARQRGADRPQDPFVRPELPGPQRMFMRDSEAQFFDRIRHERKMTPGANRAEFPPDLAVSKEPPRRRAFPRIVELVEPSYVCHGRLYFEQPNFERYGYDLGVLTAPVCLGVFYYDTFMLPYHFWTDLKDRSECNVGKCLPGDPAPFLVPPERFSVTGLVGQAGAIIGISYLMPALPPGLNR